MLFRLLLSIGLLALLTGSGCYRPNFLHPGSAPYQRHQATLHDPYPDGDAAPEITGGRPRDFQNPLPEPVRNRWLRDSWWSG
jgi:hypothetical protein